MAKISIFNIGKANAEINAGHEAADKALTAAKITSIAVDGKDVPASDAPLAAKISAVASLVSAGDKTQDISELIASNGQVAAQVEDLTAKLTTANATTSAQAQKINTISAELVTSQASVATLTAKNTELSNLLDASSKEAARVTGIANAQKTALAQDCIECGCLALVGEDGKPLAADASADVKLAAALKLSSDDLRKSFKGAVNTAMSKTGVSLFAIPTAPVGEAKKTELKGRARFVAAGIASATQTK